MQTLKGGNLYFTLICNKDLKCNDFKTFSTIEFQQNTLKKENGVHIFMAAVRCVYILIYEHHPESW